MYQIDNATVAPILPTPQAAGTPGYFRRGNPGTGTLATIVDDDFLNTIMLELMNVITTAGITLDKEDNTQLYQAIQILLQGVPYATSSSSPNTYTATLSPALIAYSVGNLVQVKFTNANTGSATINLNALGAKTIKRPNGSNLSSGDIAAGMVGFLSYDGTNFQLLNAQTIKESYIQNNSFVYFADAGSANSISGSLTPAPSAYVTGQHVFTKVAATNTGASTININGLGSKNIKRLDGTALQANDLFLGMIAHLVYDGTNFQLQNPNRIIRSVQTQYITATGTYTPSAGLLYADVELVGGGGGGGGTYSTGTKAGIGCPGGAGGYAKGRFTAAQIGASQACTIGAGGANGIGGPAPVAATAGGSTSFGSLMSATGGARGQALQDLATNQGFGGGIGGTGTGGDIQVTGQGGGSSLVLGGSTASITGDGGSTKFGHGGAGGSAGLGGSIAGTNGSGYGSGGGGCACAGAINTLNGGDGAPGIIVITEYCSV